MSLVYLLPSGGLATSLGGTDNGLFSIDSGTGVLSRTGALTAGTTYNVAYLVFDTTTGLISGRRDTITATAAAATYLGPVTNAARVPNTALTGNTYARGSTRHYVRGASPAYIQPVYVGYFTTGNALGNAQTLSLSVTDTAGNVIAATFGGASSGTIPDGGILIADPVYGTFTKDGTISLNPSVQVASGGKIAVKDFPKATAYGEKFNAGTSPIADGYADVSTFNIYPQAVLGPTSAPGVLIIGDSRAEKYFDTQDGTFDIGTVERHAGASFGYINLSIGGTKAYDYTGSTNAARVMAKYCSVANVEIGINNIGTGDSDATLQSQLASLKANFSDCPAWVLQTMTPETESSDGWTTTTNQNAGPTTTATQGPRFFSIAGDDPRKSNNRWRRSVPSGWAGCLDATQYVQTAGSGGIEGGAWLAPSGTPYTGDGVHETHAACLAIFNGIAAAAKSLFQSVFVAPNTLAGGGSSLIATTTALTSSANPATAGASVTLTATVTPASGTANPTGTVTFKDGTTTLGTGTLNASGVATYATTALAQGSHSLTAVYGGDSTFAASTSAALTQTVNAAGGSGATVISRHNYYDTTTVTPTSGTLADGSTVLTVTDKGSNGYTETAGASGSRPTYATAGIGSKGALNFTDATWLTSNAPASPGAAAWVFVLKTNQHGATLTLVGSDIGGGMQIRVEANGGIGIVREVQAVVVQTGGGLVPDNTPIILSVMYDPVGGAYRFRINGADVASGTKADNNFNAAAKTYIGANGYFVLNGGGVEGYAGLMGAKVVLAAPSLAQIQAEEAAYAQVFGITLSS